MQKAFNMLSPSKIAKCKPFTAPAHKDTLNSKPRMKFTNGLNESANALCKRSFDTAENMLNRGNRNFIQSKLSDDQHKHENDDQPKPSTSKRTTGATVEFQLMPKPSTKPVNIKRPFEELPSGSNQENNENKNAPRREESQNPSNPMNKSRIERLIIVGKVDYCLKIHHLYPRLNCFWEVYGKVVKILPGKHRNENILILRTHNNRGPVLQSIYYDFEEELKNFPPGASLRAVGEFLNENRLRTFRLEQFDCTGYESELARIQKVQTQSLMQGNINS